MPRPKNANLSNTIFASDAAFGSHPGEAYDGQPNKVEPTAGAEGWIPGQRPPAENFNWQTNRIEKIVRYLDTIDVRNFVPPSTVADFQIRGIDFDGARYVAGGNDGSTPTSGKALSSPNGWQFDADESGVLDSDALYDDNPFDVVASGRRVYLFTPGTVQVRDNVSSMTLHVVNEDVSGDFYSHKDLIGQAWKDPELADTVWIAWLSQKSAAVPPNPNDWISIGRVGPSGHTWTTGVNAGTGRVGLSTGHIQDIGNPRVDRAMFADLDGIRVCICNGPDMSGNQLLISTDSANDFLAWNSAGMIADVVGAFVGLERSGNFLVAVTDLGRCYRSTDGSTWTLVGFPLGVLTERLTFLAELSPAMIRHGSVLLAVGELSAEGYGDGGEAVVIVGSTDHGETWEVFAGWPGNAFDFVRIRSMQDGRVAVIGYDGTASQIAFTLRTKSVPVGEDDS